MNTRWYKTAIFVICLWGSTSWCWAADSTDDRPERRWQGLVTAALVGATHRWIGNENIPTVLSYPRPFGKRAFTDLSRYSPGVGFKLGLGGMLRGTASGLSFSATLGYERSDHTTDSGRPETARSSIQLVQPELRASFERWRFKPYFAVVGGWVRLGLPGQEVINDETPLRRVDAWMSGGALGASIGMLYEVTPGLAFACHFGYRINVYTTSNEGSFSPDVLKTDSLVTGLGVEWWPKLGARLAGRPRGRANFSE